MLLAELTAGGPMPLAGDICSAMALLLLVTTPERGLVGNTYPRSPTFARGTVATATGGCSVGGATVGALSERITD
jgi:hypothetical protein